MPDPAGGVFADAVTVIAAVAAAVRGRFGLPMVSLAGVAARSRCRVGGCWRRAGRVPQCNTSRPCRRRRSRRKSVRCRVFQGQQRRRPVAVGDDEAKVRAGRARAIGLFRYQLIREAADPALSTKERGKMVRELASREHIDPFGRRVRISRQTIDRWIRDWRAGGFDALVPSPRQCTRAHPGRGAGVGGGAAAGEPGAHRRGHSADLAHPAGLGAG